MPAPVATTPGRGYFFLILMDTRKVIMTEAAKAVVADLHTRYGPLMFHQSGGCCDGSSPMCFQLGDFKTGSSDVLVDEVEGCSRFTLPVISMNTGNSRS